MVVETALEVVVVPNTLDLPVDRGIFFLLLWIDRHQG